MFDKVEIRNFMSHKNTELEFLPGVNVIIGESDRGKSAAFNAIRWITSNRPLGEAFRSSWGGDTSAKLFLSEGNTIERLRTNSKNEYLLNGKALTAFGTEVPEQVLELLQMDEYNIQAQMDPPFMLSHTPGEAARMLNRAASLEEIDQVTTSLTSAYRRLNKKMEQTSEQVTEKKTDLEQYANLPIIEKKLEAVEQKEKSAERMETDLISLRNIVAKILRLENDLGKTDHIPQALSKFEAVEMKYQAEYKTKMQDQTELNDLVQVVIETTEELKQTDGADEAYKKASRVEKRILVYQEKQASSKRIFALYTKGNQISLDLEKTAQIDVLYKLSEEVEEKVTSYSQDEKEQTSLSLLYKQAQRLKKDLDEAESMVLYYESKYEAEFPEVCPLCGTEVEVG